MTVKTYYKTVTQLIEEGDRFEGTDDRCPFDLSLIPNTMGINLCSVQALSWQRQVDGQLVNLQIFFIPAEEKPVEGKKLRSEKKVSFLSDWELIPYNYGEGDSFKLRGKVHSDSRFEDGEVVTTSRVLNIDYQKMIAETKNTLYKLS